jgi:protein disulfide-isomerase A6
MDRPVHVLLSVLQGVRGYPTIMALGPHSKSWQEYQGDRNAAAISNWATSLIGNEAATLKKDSDLTSLLAQCGGSSASSSKRKQANTASWGLCMVLVSSKSSVPSLWKALSVAYKGKVAFGFVAAESKAVLAQLGAAGELGSGQSSRVVLICNGDVRTAEAYTGEQCSRHRFLSRQLQHVAVLLLLSNAWAVYHTFK